MLPTEQILIWQQLSTLLSGLLSEAAPDPKVTLDRAIELFESNIITQDLDGLPDPIAGKMRSYVTESHRLLRLLSMDILLLATARNPATISQRRQAYQDKLKLIIRYCQAVTDTGAEDLA
jgi:hypothetical protein